MNTTRRQARSLATSLWTGGMGIQMVFRPTTDFFISPTMSGSHDNVLAQQELAQKFLEPYLDKGSLLQMPGGAILFKPYFENYSTGAHIENIYWYDPFDEQSLADTKELIASSVDPNGPFRGFGVPLMGGGLSIEPELKIHERWGEVYDNYTHWHQEVKKMLDPNDVSDWSAYIPPVFP